MALSRVKTWSSGEVLTASDLNTEFNNIITNASSLFSPLTAGLDCDGFGLTLDGAAVTTLTSTSAVGLSFTTGVKAGTPGTTGSIANFTAHTFTDSNTAGSGTATNYTGFSIARPTLAATNASVTTTNAATVYIANAPAAGTNETITRAYALWVDDGAVRIDGHLDALITQNSQSAAYTTVLTDNGKHILHPTADNNARTFTIDSNANVPYPIGATITFINQINTVTIAITSDTLTQVGTGSTGSRTLAANGLATAIKVAATSWVISGTGLT
jgi:hypothetical protein